MRGKPSNDVRVPFERTSAALAHMQSLVVFDVMQYQLVLDKNNFVPVSTSYLINIRDRVGSGVANKIYLVDLASCLKDLNHACVSMN